MKNLTELIDNYDVEILRASDKYILHLKYSYKDKRFINEHFIGDTIEEALSKALYFIKKKKNAGFYLEEN